MGRALILALTAVILAIAATTAAAVEAPAVLAPADGAVVNQATDAIVVAPHNGRITSIGIAPSPVTREQYYGSPPGSDPALAGFSGILLASGTTGATIFPLAQIYASSRPYALPPGTYYYRFMWSATIPGSTYCSVEAADGTCLITGTFPPQFVESWSPIRSFAIPAQRPDIASPPPKTPACRSASLRYLRWSAEVKRRGRILGRAKSKAARERLKAGVVVAVKKRQQANRDKVRLCRPQAS